MSPNSTILGHSLNGHLTLSKYFQYTPQVRGESKTGTSAVGILLLRGDPARPDLLCVFTLSNEVTELDFPHSTIIVDSGLVYLGSMVSKSLVLVESCFKYLL